MGEQKVALELMCQDDSVRNAMRIGGKPCAADVAAAAAPVAPATQVAAATPAPAPAAIPTAPKPAWCAKAAPATDASKAYVEQVCGR
jgi:hypothetical protein